MSAPARSGIVLDAFPAGAGSGYIARVSVEGQQKQVDSSSSSSSSSHPPSSAHVPLFILLDVSGSMGQNVRRLVQEVLPSMLVLINHPPDAPVHVFAFESATTKHVLTQEKLKNSPLKSLGGTNLAPAIHMAHEEAKEMVRKQKNEGQAIPLRILTLTDGELQDQAEALTAAQTMRKFLDERFIVNSQAVRVILNTNQPDTRGLTGMMQLSSAVSSSLLDIPMYQVGMDDIAGMIARYFADDGLAEKRVVLEASSAVFQTAPWKPATPTFSLSQGENIFWLKDINTQPMKLGGPTLPVKFVYGDERLPVTLNVAERLDEAMYHTLLRTKIDYFMQQLRVLKVLNTPDSLAETQKILTYWKHLDSTILQSDGFDLTKALASNHSLASRLQALRTHSQRSEKSVSARMAQIANDDKVNQLNAAQSAEFLRAANTKALARRAVANSNGLDFNSVARRELHALKSRISELQDLDDSSHQVSFYSQETTLSGLRCIASMSTDDLDSLDITDLLKLFNLVGLACAGPIGDFPDPMTYRLDGLYPGCFISLADILTAQSIGGSLTVPGGRSTDVITNCVPFYDDPRIHTFLRSHCPTILEYIASVGMRRVIVEVSMTYTYTLLNGVWKMVFDLNPLNARTQLNAETFVKMTQAFQLAVGGYFNHVMPFLKEESAVGSSSSNNLATPMSMYISRCGATNMISPLLNLFSTPNINHAAIIPRILRALYSYEIWQMVRKSYKHSPNSIEIAQKTLWTLIALPRVEEGGKVAKFPLRPLFEDEPINPVFPDTYEINDAVVQQEMEKCWFVDYVTLLPSYLSCVAGPNGKIPLQTSVAMLKSVPVMSDATILQSLSINYSLHKFRFFNIVQALIYRDSESRFDVQAGKSKFEDLCTEEVGDEMVKKLVRQVYEVQYKKDLVAKGVQERQVLQEEFTARLCLATTLQERLDLLKNGLTRGKVTVSMTNAVSPVFSLVKDAMLDLRHPVSRRAELVELLLLSLDHTGAPVWNNGNVLLMKELDAIQKAYESAPLNSSASSSSSSVAPLASNSASSLASVDAPVLGIRPWSELLASYNSRRRHIYRDSENHHGHSNTKPSYFALGYTTIGEMAAAVASEVWTEYQSVHHNCCGIPELMAAAKNQPYHRLSQRQRKIAARRASQL